MAEAKAMPGRNEPCHCGSGKKYKQCCLEKDEAKRREQRASGEDVAPSGGGASGSKPAPASASAKKQTQQPWKGPRNTKGFQKLTTPRRSGGGG
jgi:hypothetical protein